MSWLFKSVLIRQQLQAVLHDAHFFQCCQAWTWNEFMMYRSKVFLKKIHWLTFKGENKTLPHQHVRFWRLHRAQRIRHTPEICKVGFLEGRLPWTSQRIWHSPKNMYSSIRRRNCANAHIDLYFRLSLWPICQTSRTNLEKVW